MAAPIEIAWGGGNWRNNEVETATPYVEAAVDLAVSGMEMLQLPLSCPKRLLVCKVSEGQLTRYGIGHCEDESNVDLTLSRRFLRGFRHTSHLGLATQSLVHELTHSERFYRFQEGSFAEYAISEGLAYCADDELAGTLNFTEPAYLEEPNEMDDDDVQRLVEDFIYDNDTYAIEEASEADFDRIIDKWYEKSQGALGDLVGIFIVSKLLDEDGLALAEIINMDADDIIDSMKGRSWDGYGVSASTAA